MSAATPLKIRSKNPKSFEDSFPRLDDGKVDWATVKRRVTDNIDLSNFTFGKMMPNAKELEEAVLGACLIDALAFPIAQEALLFETRPFYTEAMNTIWVAIWELSDRKEPIDLLTTTFELKKMGTLDSIGGAYFLTELTARVGSSANIEYHSRIVYQMCLKRKMLKFCTQAIRNIYDDSTDIFDLVQELGRELNDYDNPRAALKAMDMNAVMEKAANALPKSLLVGEFIKWNDVAILFSGPANGKSIFAIQAADAISKGKSLFSGHLRNECGEQKVLYFDFELQFSDFKSRYMDASGAQYDFKGENFIRVGNDEDNPSTFAEFAKNADYIISRNIEKHKPSVVFVDNITALANGATADYEVAARIMDTLMLLKKKYKLTVVVLAHTPKRYNTTEPLSINDLAGSAMLGNYADSIFTIGASKMGDSVKYMKQIKVRSGVKRYDEDNILQVSIEKEGAFLQYKTLEEPTGRERDHLTDFNQEDDTDMLTEAAEFKRQGMGLRKIITQLGLKMSHTQLGMKLKAFEAASVQNEFLEGLEGVDLVIVDHAQKDKKDVPF